MVPVSDDAQVFGFSINHSLFHYNSFVKLSKSHWGSTPLLLISIKTVSPFSLSSITEKLILGPEMSPASST